MASGSGDVGRRRSRVRPGVITLVVGLGMFGAAVAWTAAVADRTSLGVALALVASYAISAWVVFEGVTRLRDPDPGDAPHGRSGDLDGDATWVGDPGRRSLRCRLGGHRQVFVPRTAEHPPMWQCRRCGRSGRTHLAGGRAWVCEIPLVEHRYVHVGASQDHPEHWRCGRCGRRRFSPPTTAGESLNATRAATMGIRRDRDS
jgi:ribosomal protein S27AE